MSRIVIRAEITLALKTMEQRSNLALNGKFYHAIMGSLAHAIKKIFDNASNVFLTEDVDDLAEKLIKEFELLKGALGLQSFYFFQKEIRQKKLQLFG